MLKSKLSKFALLFGSFLFILLALYTFKPPKALSLDADLDKFSAVRAFQHIEKIAQKPHSMGTEEHENVRNYILDELNKLGLESSVQSTSAIYDFRGSVSVGFVHNVVGVLKGSEEGKSILITGHYDSQPNTAGAADDGVAIASMLEAARALKQLPQLKNDIIFLFSDGEEAGLFGAQAFIQQHPLKDNIGLVLNLEARGNKGVSFTYEVSEENGWIMREYEKAVRYPIASSLAYEVYKLLSNNSDFTIHKKAGYTGFNTAFIEGYVAYHSMIDNADNLSLRSLQHQGSYVMDISTHFGNLVLENKRADDLVYFNLVRFLLISYPQSWNVFIIALIVILFINVVVWGVRQQKISLWRSLLSLIVFMVTIGLSLGAVILLQKGILRFYPWYENFYDGNFYNVSYYFMAFASLCLLIFSLIYSLLFKKLKDINLWIGILLFGIILLIVIQLYIPTGLYLIALPLVLILSWILLRFTFNWNQKSWQKDLALLVIYFPIIMMTIPMIKILYVTFSLEMAIGGSFLWILLIAFLLPVVITSFSIKRWALTLASFVALVLFLGLTHLNSTYTAERPLQSKLMYCQNLDTNESLWVAPNSYMDEWKQQFFDEPVYGALTEMFPNASRIRIKNKARWAEIQAPQMQVLSDSIIDGLRVLKLHFKSLRGGENGQFYIHKNALLEKAFINQLELTDQDFYEFFYGDFHYFNFYGMQAEGFELELYCSADAEFEIIMIDKKMGMPIFDEKQQFPHYIIPAAGYESNQSLARKSWII